MNFLKIAKLCGKDRIVYVSKYEDDTWIGTPAALFRCKGNIETDVCGILTLIGIPQSKHDEYTVYFADDTVTKMLEIASDKHLEEVTEIPLDLCLNEKPVMICATRKGAVLYNRKIVDILNKSYPRYFLAEYGNRIVLAVKTDNELAAVIQPLYSPSEKQMKDLTRCLEQFELVRKNNIHMRREEEQVELDDYPYDDIDGE